MKLSHTTTYDAPLAEVFAMLTDPAFREHAAKASGVIEVKVDVTQQDEVTQVRMDQVQPVQGVPSFATKFAGETTQAVVVETWDSQASSHLEITTPGKPTRVTGGYRLSEIGGRTTQQFEGECKVSVPLIGGKLEKVMGDLFVQGREKEAAAGVAWLRGDKGERA
ncbi:DUF2505 domain-containing protein [Nocardioides marmoribigeumensis]|uniref:Uncharacterized protein YndB with AHSA1/START domain n=1 Tax=Nocardioides marmoribigeumensis TaxID=433649 RepID=A0ABU2C0A7_9ACTN|nr:DUF2505 domain-containing protein [Nocardioides marmoribigeumensis]MDR7364044.1 uncharacterized protein YndB with AHSA1/START domain [Nocardioides marmoribigeumensis]